MTKKPSPPAPKQIKDQKIYINLSKVIQQFLAGKHYTPMGQAALLKRLKIPPSLHPLCKEIISDLLKEGSIELNKKQLSIKKASVDLIKGTLRMHPRGFGFVIPDHPAECPQDVFIPKHLTDNAVDGDKVEISIDPNSQSEKGPEGKIVSVLKRGRTHVAGTIRSIDAQGHFLAYVPLLGQSKPVEVLIEQEMPAPKIGDRVIMKVINWGGQNSQTSCQLSHILGHISDPSCDVEAAAEEFDLATNFSKAAINEAKEFGKRVAPKDLKKRKDLTKLTAFTIDPDTAKDYDDALSLTKDRKGIYHLGVHIADVAHYVSALSALDLEASERCNSTYFPGTCLPMLPEELSNHLCSLREKVIRLTVSVLMDFDKEGHLLSYKVVRSYIKSAKRLTYQEAKTIIDGKKKSALAPPLALMVELCLLLKKQRFSRGSIDFSLPELVLEIDKQGEPQGMKTVEYDISHQLVEEFMLKANEVVAKHLSDCGKPVLFRIHEEPAQENFQDFFSLARNLGFSLPDKPAHKDLQTLFESAKKTPFAQQLFIGFIRSMKLAYYSPENVGHFGLALEHYCHFTSPIRRYTDLIIQRLLFDEIEPDVDLQKIALKCSDQERVSFRAEMSVKLLKKLRLLNRYFKEDPKREYAAIVTKIKPFGLFFELSDLMIEGFLHISELENDYFYYDAERHLLTGRATGIRHAVGESVKVSLTAIDFIVLESKWELVTTFSRPKHRTQDRRSRKR